MIANRQNTTLKILSAQEINNFQGKIFQTEMTNAGVFLCEVQETHKNALAHSGWDGACLKLLAQKSYTFTATGDETITAIDPAGIAAQITAANLDTGTLTIGRDYYIFATVENGASSYAVSLNKELDKDHLVGGFHYGKNRRTNENLQPVNKSGEERGADWETNVFDGIVPRSVWTLSHRPKSSPEGMVYLGHGLWVDIYLSSDDGAGGIISAHNKKPLTMKNWYEFSELALAKGKRLLTYGEWCKMALGSPQGLEDSNENAWTATSNNAPQKTGFVENAVSSFGCRDAVGNVWEWLDTFMSDPDGGEWRWWEKMQGYGKLFMAGSTGLIALLAGGHWDSGASAGARAVTLGGYPWLVNTTVGARGACDSL